MHGTIFSNINNKKWGGGAQKIWQIKRNHPLLPYVMVKSGEIGIFKVVFHHCIKKKMIVFREAF